MINHKVALKHVYNPNVPVEYLKSTLDAYEMLDCLPGLSVEHLEDNEEIKRVLRKAIKDRELLEKI